MEPPGGNSDSRRPFSSNANNRRYRVQFSAANFIRSPISTLLEYSGLLRPTPRSTHQFHDSDSLLSSSNPHHLLHDPSNPIPNPNLNTNANANGEVSIRIIGATEQDGASTTANGAATTSGALQSGNAACTTQSSLQQGSASAALDAQEELGGERGANTGGSQQNDDVTAADTEAVDGAGATNRDSAYQRYDIQQAARWIEQILPFSLLLLIVFIRQHLQGCLMTLGGVPKMTGGMNWKWLPFWSVYQGRTEVIVPFLGVGFVTYCFSCIGFFVTIWIAVVMFKSNDILRKQTALKGERRISVLVGICIIFALHVIGVYWWYRNDDLLYPLIMLPPKAIPPFWDAVFIIMVNDTLVRQAAMVFKCLLLMYYKNSRGRKYRRQGQILTLVEYFLLLYRALLPTPVWYRFFLNKEYGSLFSSLMTGLYLTFKLTSVVEKVQSFFTSVKALSRKEVNYGAYATSEQVSAAGDMCAICQEKMHAPILLRCKHIFCEDCVSEWFERERTCPLCRALVKPADLKSFSDGSTSLFFQLF